MDDLLRRAADAIAASDALLVSAGAGMGVDSGLPDFRGAEGFWRAYPPYARLGLSFSELANPRWFALDPALAWGFYGHRLAHYRATRPHAGFGLLKAWGAARPAGAFVFTSNVDGQFQRAGFAEDRIVECHGAIDFLQCTADCGLGVVPADDVSVEVDPETFRATGPLPTCPRCGALARPNILMFGDFGYLPTREGAQTARFEAWLAGLAGKRLAIVECGAGTAVPTVRFTSERVARALGATLVRINAREPQVPRGHVGLPMRALEALVGIDARLRGLP
jgi:NAD-dependent SIR2 family protein deacetylase